MVSNLRLSALERAGLGYAAVHARNPRLVYCSISGYGPSGPDRDRPAYDVGAFWARAGVAASLAPKGADPPQQRGGMGDHTTAVVAVSAICAALLARQQHRGGSVRRRLPAAHRRLRHGMGRQHAAAPRPGRVGL